MKKILMLMPGIVLLASLSFGQNSKANNDVNYETELYVTIVLREKLNGNEIVSVEKQQEKLKLTMKANDFDATKIEELYTKTENVKISESLNLILKERYLLYISKTSDELASLCKMLAQLDVYEIYITKNRNAISDTSSTLPANNNGILKTIPVYNSPNTSGVVAPQINIVNISQILGRILDISVILINSKK